jgi:hypothetical protein
MILLSKGYSCFKNNVDQEVLNYVYENTVPEAPLRKALCDICAWRMDVSYLDEFKGMFPKEFLGDYALQQKMRIEGMSVPPVPSTSQLRQYYVVDK